MSTTPVRAAAQLRKLADVLDTAEDVPIGVTVDLSAPGYSARQEPDRVATVDSLAALFDLTAGQTRVGSLTWYHEARADLDGVDLRLYTNIEAPAQRCACGAVCTHKPGAV
jgi:hypothetical protein